MKKLRVFLSHLVIYVISAGICLGFDTGPHQDLTRSVLAEHEFAEDAIKAVQVESWLTDYYSNSPTYPKERREVLEKLHFDNLFNADQVTTYWAFFLRNLKAATQKAARDNDRLAMLVTLGIGLHAVQDFYAHSNWAETHPGRADGEYRTDTFLTSPRPLSAAVTKGLHTGKYPEDRTSGPGPDPIPAGAEIHGGYEKGLNKDSPIRPHWDEAYVFAYAASHEIVGAMKKWADEARPDFWSAAREYTTDAAERRKLDLDVAAVRNMSMWFKGNGQDGHWKGNGSGTNRFFTAFSSKWVGTNSSIFVKTMRDGRIQDQIAADLYTKKQSPPIPPVGRFLLRRRAIIVRLTYIAESKDPTSIRSKITIGGGSDFYSRITIGGQEYWGRTIQKSRETADPWYEIHFIDQGAPTVPITFSVWDEDDINALKDEHTDINPAPGILDLSCIFSTSNGSLAGDINGMFTLPDRAFTSEGERPDKHRAIIRGFVLQHPLR